jgi:hypothetical protein
MLIPAKKQRRTSRFLLVILLVFGSVWFGIKALMIQGGLNSFPDHIHGWTQSDRYAIAVHFAVVTLNPLYPGTFNLNPKLEQVTVDDSGISAMDLPITEYLSSWLMRLFGQSDPKWSRLVQMLFAFAGLYALFRIVFDRGGGIFSLIPVLVLWGSPAWLYYATGFIPTISAISLALGGSYFLATGKKYYLGIFLCVMAGLVRTPLLIVLLAWFIGMLWNKENRKNLPKYLIASVLVFFPWFLWKQHLQANYGTMFLTRLMPADSIDASIAIFNESLQHWWEHLFSQWSWLIIVIAFILLPVNWKRIFRNQLLLTGIAGFGGAITYSLLMTKQFMHHDYYYLDAFFVPLILLVSGILIEYAALLKRKYVAATTVLIVLLLFVLQNKHVHAVLMQRVETGPWDRYHLTLENFKGSSVLLDQLGISREEKLVVIDAYSTNAPLMLLQRRGYTILNTEPAELRKVRNLPVQYAVMQDLFMRSDVIRSLPEIVNDWERIGGNGKISVFRKSFGKRTEEDFADVGTGEIYTALNLEDGFWKNLMPAKDSGYFFKDVYGPTFKMKIPKGMGIAFWADFIISTEKESSGIELIFRIHEGSKRVVRQFSLNDYSAKLDRYYFPVMVPFEASDADSELEFFIHNPGSVLVHVEIPEFRILNNKLRDRINR